MLGSSEETDGLGFDEMSRVGVWLVFSCVVGAGVLWLLSTERPYPGQVPTAAETCRAFARSMKNAVGTTVDGAVRLDAAECEGKTLVHLYTLVGHEPVDPLLEAEVGPLLPPDLREQFDELDVIIRESTRRFHHGIYCSDLAGQGVDAVWAYRDEGGASVFSISMQPGDCEKED